MHLAEGLQRLGFRKWYERQLLQSHAHLVLTILSTLGLMGALEAASKFHSWQDQLTDALALLASAAIGLWSLRRYLYLLKHAEYVAHQARCRPARPTHASRWSARRKPDSPSACAAASASTAGPSRPDLAAGQAQNQCATSIAMKLSTKLEASGT